MTMASVEKISISLPLEEIAWARERAEKAGTSVSAVVVEALANQRRAAAARRLLQSLGGTDDITQEEQAAVMAEWSGKNMTAKGRRHRQAVRRRSAK
jgi:hypothetical protein